MAGSVTPMMQQYLDIKQKHQDCILFFRLGDFYEMFFEDAQLVSQRAGTGADGQKLRPERTCAHVRHSVPRRQRIYRPADRKGLQGGHLRAADRSGPEQGTGGAGRDPHHHSRHGGRPRHAGRKKLQLCALCRLFRQGSLAGVGGCEHRRVCGARAARRGKAADGRNSAHRPPGDRYQRSGQAAHAGESRHFRHHAGGGRVLQAGRGRGSCSATSAWPRCPRWAWRTRIAGPLPPGLCCAIWTKRRKTRWSISPIWSCIRATRPCFWTGTPAAIWN